MQEQAAVIMLLVLITYLHGGCEQVLLDAAATLELFVATGGAVSIFADARTRAAMMATAVRRVMGHGG